MTSVRLFVAAALLLALVAMPAVANAATGRIYVVQPDDTLSRIAARYGVSVEALVELNGLANPDDIWVGQRLTIPGYSAAWSVGGARTTYRVRLGDNLSQIASQFGVTVRALMRTNAITHSDLVVAGTILRIPTGIAGIASGQPLAGPGIPSNSIIAGPSIGGGLRFVVSISEQSCWLYDGNMVSQHWACSTGRAGSATAPGNYTVLDKLPVADGSTWNWWLPYWLGIYHSGNLENGIHGLPYSMLTGQRFWGDSIGTPVTYGCVVLSNDAAKQLYNAAFVGMPVIIHP